MTNDELEKRAIELAKKRYPPDWSSGVDSNSRYRHGFRAGFEEGYRAAQEWRDIESAPNRERSGMEELNNDGSGSSDG